MLEKQVLFQSKQGGLLKEPILGWRDVKVWSRTLKELLIILPPRLIFVLSD